MTEMSLLFRQMMRTLREARSAVQAEMELHAIASSADLAPLVYLQKSAEEFGDQAASLSMMMRDQKEEKALIAEAEELVSYFQATERQILVVLGHGEAEEDYWLT